MERDNLLETDDDDDVVSETSESDSEGRQHAYEEMFAQWEHMAKQLKNLTILRGNIESEKSSLETKMMDLQMQVSHKDKEAEKLTADLLKENLSLKSCSLGTSALNDMMNIQKPYGDRTSIGYKMLCKDDENLKT